MPSWLSCSTGMSIIAPSVCCTSKHCGAAMSVRCTPANTETILLTTAAISSVSRTVSGSGKPSIPAISRRNMHLASADGSAASGPRSPCPTTELPSVMTATLLPRMVRSQVRSGS